MAVGMNVTTVMLPFILGCSELLWEEIHGFETEEVGWRRILVAQRGKMLKCDDGDNNNN